MKFPLILSFFIFFCFTCLHAQKPASPGEVETKWPGIHYRIIAVERTPGGKVIVAIRITATARAPKEGTLIGIPVPIPPDATKEDIDRGIYAPQPFSWASSVITDDKTGKAYSTVRPAPGDNSVSSEILCTLRPAQGESIAVEFALPPPPKDAAGNPGIQTASLLLTNAEKPITKIVIPPPAASATSPTPSRPVH